MTNITGVSTMTTDQTGTNVCNQSACSLSPCQNGATCQADAGLPSGYTCTCGLGFTGQNCENDINECENGEWMSLGGGGGGYRWES